MGSNTLRSVTAEEFRDAIVGARLRFAGLSLLGVAVAITLIVLAVEVPGYTDYVVLAALAALVLGSIAGRYALDVVVPPDLARLGSGERMHATVTSVRAFAPAIVLRFRSGGGGEAMRHAVRLEVADPKGTREITVIGFVPFEPAERLRRGATVELVIDREDPELATIDWSTLR